MSPGLKGRLAAEVFQIISEGLSNILRHTRARKAFINILCEETNLLLAIGNELVGQKQATKQFMPRSIAERVKMLGGKTAVDINSDGHTVVHVTIPI